MSEFFAMGGYAFFIWMAYGMAALLAVLEVVAVCSRHSQAKRLVQHSGMHEEAGHVGATLKEAVKETP